VISYQVISWFQAYAFKCNLYRYIAVEPAAAELKFRVEGLRRLRDRVRKAHASARAANAASRASQAKALTPRRLVRRVKDRVETESAAVVGLYKSDCLPPPPPPPPPLQLTHSLKAPGFQPLNLGSETVSNFACKCNLYRYAAVGAERRWVDAVEELATLESRVAELESRLGAGGGGGGSKAAASSAAELCAALDALLRAEATPENGFTI
jgi:hypothetical protein